MSNLLFPYNKLYAKLLELEAMFEDFNNLPGYVKNTLTPEEYKFLDESFKKLLDLQRTFGWFE